jgi:hypothetical protein
MPCCNSQTFGSNGSCLSKLLRPASLSFRVPGGDIDPAGDRIGKVIACALVKGNRESESSSRMN